MREKVFSNEKICRAHTAKDGWEFTCAIVSPVFVQMIELRSCN